MRGTSRHARRMFRLSRALIARDESETRSEVWVLLRRADRRPEGEAVRGRRRPRGDPRAGGAQRAGGRGDGAASACGRSTRSPRSRSRRSSSPRTACRRRFTSGARTAACRSSIPPASSSTTSIASRRRRSAGGFHLVFIGDPKHREVIGYTQRPRSRRRTTSSRTIEEAESIDWSPYRGIKIFYQTTLNAEDFEDVVQTIERRAQRRRARRHDLLRHQREPGRRARAGATIPRSTSSSSSAARRARTRSTSGRSAARRSRRTWSRARTTSTRTWLARRERRRPDGRLLDAGLRHRRGRTALARDERAAGSGRPEEESRICAQNRVSSTRS